ncbi:MAG: amidohydrolase [Kiritimatiellaeota bacterium]|nr:amidohydrolase [Kiritimatiellota bacterium]
MIFTADYIITQDSKRTVIKNGALAVDGSVISYIGKGGAHRLGELVIDLGSSVIMPGLIDAHTHIPMSFQRGYADDKALMAWLTEDIFPIEPRLTHDIVRDASLFACAELIRFGCTAIYDMYFMQSAVFEAVNQSGLRAVLGECVTRNFPTFAAKNKTELFSQIRRNAAAWKGHPRIRGAVAPHAVYTTTPELLRECRELADECGFLFSTHLSETAAETRDCVAGSGLRPVAYLDSLGVIRDDTALFHCVDLDESDMTTLAARGAVAVHNPASNMKLASGVAPVGAMRAHGIPVALGTDGPASNNAQNMFREMYLAALLHKVANLDPLQTPAQTVLDMATLGGAAALREPLIGSLEIGKKADFIALSLDSPNMRPVHNIVSNIVYATCGMENRLTVVDGKILYKDGEFTTMDYEKIKVSADRLAEWI